MAERLSAKLPDDFARSVLAGSLGVAWDSANPIRANLFAAGMREALTYVLHLLAPDEEVKACDWYVRHREQQRKSLKNPLDFRDNPTRTHRMIYAAQGGLPDAFLDTHGVEVEDDHKKLRSVMDDLSKYTHVRPGVLLIEDEDVQKFMQDALRAFTRFLDTIRSVRDTVADAVSEQANEVVGSILLENVVQELDELSTHTFVEEVVADDISVISIGSRELSFVVKGSVFVELNYGSGSDFRRGDGATSNGSFPFSVTMKAAVGDMKPFVVGRVNVDNSKFYE